MLMDAVVMRRFGGPEVLEFQTIEAPVPGPGEVLVKVAAVSVNRSFDIGARQGKSPFELALPLILGVDPTGAIADVGSGVDRRRIGEPVFVSIPAQCGRCDDCRARRVCNVSRRIGIAAPGGYAQYICVPDFQARRIPAGLDAGEAAIIGRHGEAAWSEVECADIKPGEHVLIMGAAGALGSFLIQLAKLKGATVTAVASSEERLSFCRDLGADHGINYRTANIAHRATELTGGAGMNVVFENVSDPSTFPQAFESLGRGGRLLTIGFHGGAVVPVDMRRLFMNQLTIRSAPMWLPGTNAFEQCFDLATAGRLRASVGARFPLRQAADAHRLVEAGAVNGKVIIEPH